MDKKCVSCGIIDDGNHQFLTPAGNVFFYCGGCAVSSDFVRIPDGYMLVKSAKIAIPQETQNDALSDLLAKYEEQLHYRYAGDTLARVGAIYRRLESIAADKQHDMDALTQTVIENLLGMRVLVNMILNGNWTHSQKNNTVQAMGELLQTAVKRLRDDNWDFARRYDPFAPEWSQESYYRQYYDTREELEKAQQLIKTLREKERVADDAQPDAS